ncbi:hypothetical protein PISMIDRAFT_676554 [Pisolithus microcarpus 441]|uniref:Uncharacterized protein n=1 Tax=Pisolithus microcarpus 441 TaxID=765257 RepID=A0A0C9ZJ99_9AGAM|nr:hypothetical protein PISMIDRAFT_676554 [Pisolithus microcarpus 441]
MLSSLSSSTLNFACVWVPWERSGKGRTKLADRDTVRQGGVELKPTRTKSNCDYEDRP